MCSNRPCTAKAMEQYVFMLYKHDESRAYSPGETVYVWLKSQQNTGRATVLSTPASLPADSLYAGRYLVCFHSCGSTAHVRPERLLPVFHKPQQPQQQSQHQSPLSQQAPQHMGAAVPAAVANAAASPVAAAAAGAAGGQAAGAAAAGSASQASQVEAIMATALRKLQAMAPATRTKFYFDQLSELNRRYGDGLEDLHRLLIAQGNECSVTSRERVQVSVQRTAQLLETLRTPRPADMATATPVSAEQVQQVIGHTRRAAEALVNQLKAIRSKRQARASAAQYQQQQQQLAAAAAATAGGGGGGGSAEGPGAPVPLQTWGSASSLDELQQPLCPPKPAQQQHKQQQHQHQHGQEHQQQQQEIQQAEQLVQQLQQLQHFQPPQPLVLLVASTTDFRRLARSQVTSSDGVVELGCSYGNASRMLHEHAAWLVAVDNSHEMVQEARKRNPGICFEHVDVLEDQMTLLRLVGSNGGSNGGSSGGNSNGGSNGGSGGCCDRSSGSSGLGMDAARNSTSSMAPQLVPAGNINGSIQARQVAAAACNGSHSSSSSVPATAEHHSTAGAKQCIGSSCSHSSCCHKRQPPCSVVFADIGGNRQLESLVKLVPWVLQQLRPQLLVVKSQELAAAAAAQLASQQGQQQQQQQQQQHQKESQATQQLTAQLQMLQVTETVPQLEAGAAAEQQPPVYMEVQQPQQAGHALDKRHIICDVGRWWAQLEQQCGNPASVSEPWFIAARLAGFTRNPMRYPQRHGKDGARICRPHNYDKLRGCLKPECPFDHEHCHHCLQAGHRAMDCPMP